MDSRPSDESLLLAVAERDLVADAIGDTFVAVWQKPRGFRGDGDIAAFPAPGADEPSSDPCGSFSPGARWPSPFSVGGRRLPRWMSRVP